MSDLIDRQAAIDFIDAGHLCNPNEPRWSDNEVVNFLKSRPSAQRTGRWEYVKKRLLRGGYVDERECSVCHKRIMMDLKPNFCPNCGSRMEIKDHE